MQTREEHMKWCKQRALEYVKRGDFSQAVASMGSDLEKHPETKNHAGIQLGFLALISGQLKTAEDCRKFIHGFH
jgi:hypothetical protein